MTTGLLRKAVLIILLTVAGAGAIHAQSYDRQAVGMFRALGQQPNALARYQYLEREMPKLSPANRILAQQMSAFALCELGLYTQAVLAFPLQMSQIPDLVLPDPERWRGEDALAVIARQVQDRRLVLINEVHHNAQTRVLTLRLLPRLRALGFTHLAIEALVDDPGLAERGYPVRASGTEYLDEPIHAEIVRDALRLGFVLVAYDAAEQDVRVRETAQAANLFHRVFEHDPHARLVVTAGYAHIDKGVARLGPARPMAMSLAALTGIVPLSIDQAQFAESDWGDGDDYHRLVARFPAGEAEVLVDRTSGRPWTAAPDLYDISVVLPPALKREAFGEEEIVDHSTGRYRNLGNGVLFGSESFIAQNEVQRSGWLTLQGRRIAVPIDTRLCRNQIPCVIDALHADEPDEAIAADRYAFMKSFTRTRLYLHPGRYRLRAWNAEGRTLSESRITVSGP